MFPLKKIWHCDLWWKELGKRLQWEPADKLKFSTVFVLSSGLWKKLAWDRLCLAPLCGTRRLPSRWELLSRHSPALSLGASRCIAIEQQSGWYFLCPAITWDEWQPVLIPYRTSKRSREVYIKRVLWINFSWHCDGDAGWLILYASWAQRGKFEWVPFSLL